MGDQARRENSDLDSAPLSIGALSRATGVSVETLRTWERRYGVPEPLRTPSGHRRYPLETVDLLRKVRAALDRGHRASVVLTCSRRDLESLLKLPLADSVTARPPSPTNANPDHIAFWLAELHRMDGAALDHAFHAAYKAHGGQSFVVDLAIPFMREVGERWALGQLSVAHEHFASMRLEDFLIQRWRPLSAQARGAGIVLTTLPGDEHSLPLHLAATLIVQDDLRPWVLAPGTPAGEVVRATNRLGAQAVVVSISGSAVLENAERNLAHLRSELKTSTALLVGGVLSSVPPGVTHITELGALHTALHQVNLRRGGVERKDSLRGTKPEGVSRLWIPPPPSKPRGLRPRPPEPPAAANRRSRSSFR